MTSSARQADSEEVQAVLIKNAKELHAKCRGGNWCDCQHSVNIKGELNMALIAASHADDSS
jgi:hypothetical protein